MKPALLYIALVFLASCVSRGGSVSIEAGQRNWQKFTTLHPQYELLDVRTPSEIREGFIEGARHFIDYNDPQFENKLEQLDKSKTYVVYCRSGNRSAKASSIMKRLGFQHVYNLEGGIRDWDGKISIK